MYCLLRGRLSTEIILNSYTQMIFPPICLLNLLSVSVCTYGYLLCALGCNPMPLYFVAQIVSVWGIGRIFRLGLMSLQHILIIVGFFSPAFPYFLALQDVQAHLVHLLPQPQTRPFLQEAFVPFIGEWCLKKHHLDVSCTRSYEGVITSRFSQWTELGNTCMNTNP